MLPCSYESCDNINKWQAKQQLTFAILAILERKTSARLWYLFYESSNVETEMLETAQVLHSYAYLYLACVTTSVDVDRNVSQTTFSVYHRECNLVTHLESLGVPPEELVKVTEVRNFWISLSDCCPRNPDKQQKMKLNEFGLSKCHIINSSALLATYCFVPVKIKPDTIIFFEMFKFGQQHSPCLPNLKCQLFFTCATHRVSVSLEKKRPCSCIWQRDSENTASFVWILDL